MAGKVRRLRAHRVTEERSTVGSRVQASAGAILYLLVRCGADPGPSSIKDGPGWIKPHFCSGRSRPARPMRAMRCVVRPEERQQQKQEHPEAEKEVFVDHGRTLLSPSLPAAVGSPRGSAGRVEDATGTP